MMKETFGDRVINVSSTSPKEKITDNNKLIAEFMGVNVITIDDIRANKNPIQSSADGYLKEDLEYHTSWDWLMPVIEKIEDEEDCEFRITDDWSDKKTFTCSISARRDGEVIVRGSQASDNKLKAYYLAIVKFITNNT